MSKNLLLGLTLLGLSLCSCNDSENLYTHHAARLNYNLVATTPPLLNALTGSGQFCTITHTSVTSQSYVCTFVSMTGESYTSTTQSTTINGTPLSIAGFIAGTPSMVTLSGTLAPVAFDRVCPNCYESDYLQRAVSFSDVVGHVKCPRCERVYDLNNGGIVSSGGKGSKLYRYHITASTTAMSIYN